MNTQTKSLVSVLAIVAAAPFAQAADYDDYAKVVSAVPQVEQINRPRQECRTEYVQVERQVAVQNPNVNQNANNARSPGGAIIGGLAGAIIGNQVGGGNGRTAATAAGAIVGAIAGDRIGNDSNANAANNNNVTYTTTTEQQPVRQCKTVDSWESRTNGYKVTYEYHGRSYQAVMPYDPGKRMKVKVSVSPSDY